MALQLELQLVQLNVVPAQPAQDADKKTNPVYINNVIAKETNETNQPLLKAS